MSTEEPMDEVQARTTPGTDPRVEELRREQEGRSGMAGHDAAAPTYGGVNQGEQYARPGMEGDPEPGRMESEGGYRDERGMDAEGYRDESGSYGQGNDGLDQYRTRFQDAQSRFIDDPRAAVNEAGSVLKEAVDRLMESVQMTTGDNGDTEQMRMAMRRYRDLFDRLVSSGRQ